MSAVAPPAQAADTSEQQAVILMYHHFGEDRHPSTNVRLEQFEQHLAHLDEAGYQVWPLEKVVKYLRERRPFPGRVVAITIDDAYQSVYTQAFPRLRKRGWPFTVFVSTDGVDRGYRAYMGWEQMREMQAQGASFANHSASHDYLVRRQKNEAEAQWRGRVRADIERARQRLQQELGKASALFAYPYGEFDTVLAELVKEMGFVAFGQQSGAAGFFDDLRALPRFPMAERFADIKDFRQKVASLAWPVSDVQPWSPVLAPGKNPPALFLALEPSDARLGQLGCFVSGQGRVAVQWQGEGRRRFSVQAESPLPVGRSRYNCTAPSRQAGRFYWYSHLWVRLPE
ncbi:MAG: polysaccharide deacetylase family protein [Gammaproteobacteria bacterium]|nr:polysaccharide deacetylase family protein [Gammaproteobacteria bacterium]